MQQVAIRISILFCLFLTFAANPALPASYSVLHSFGSGEDGAIPYGQLIDVNGVLYGTTQQGGLYNKGTVFKYVPGKLPHVIYSFGQGQDGELPSSQLVEINGELFGTTPRGGKYDRGTLYRVSPTGLEAVLYDFGAAAHSASFPSGSLTVLNGQLYGTTRGGGKYNYGTFFTSSQSGAVEKLFSFNAASKGCSDPNDALALVGGVFYGTTQTGGLYGGGCLYSAQPTGGVAFLVQFGSYSGDGTWPMSGVIGYSGSLFGALSQGGMYGAGALYKVTTSGSEKLVWSFVNGTGDANGPDASPINIGGTFYGTSNNGGVDNHNFGAIYSYKLHDTSDKVLHSFAGPPTDGNTPENALTAIGNVMYGVTPSGGAFSKGILFTVTP